VAPQRNWSVDFSTKEFHRFAKARAIFGCCRLGGRPAGFTLPKRQIAAKHRESICGEGFGNGHQQRCLAIRASAMGNHQTGLRCAVWSVKKAPNAVLQDCGSQQSDNSVFIMTITEDVITLPTPTGEMRTLISRPAVDGKYPGIVLFSEIFQITGPIRRTAAWLAGQGYTVATPEIYHELEPSGTVLPYDQAGADKGNSDKTAKEISSYDSDAKAALDYLAARPDANGKLGVMGICIGGHLAFRAAMNPGVSAAVCFYATDIHKGTLGKGQNDGSLARAGEIRGELLHIWGRQDPHVPLEGRNVIHARLEEAGVNFQWIEVNGQHAFLRDEGPRYDPELARMCLGFALDIFHRRLL